MELRDAGRYDLRSRRHHRATRVWDKGQVNSLEEFISQIQSVAQKRGAYRAMSSAARKFYLENQTVEAAGGRYPSARSATSWPAKRAPEAEFFNQTRKCPRTRHLTQNKKTTEMKLTIIGTGYVGLVTGTCFAEVGHRVICVDNDEAKVKKLQAGGIPIYEPGLEEMVKKNVAAGRMSFTSSTGEGVTNSDIIFIAVPTPPQPDGSVDLSYIERVARDIAGAMTTYKIVLDKSTVPVQTGDKVAETIKRYCKAKVLEFDVVSNPEFLREGFCGGRPDETGPDRHRHAYSAPRGGYERSLHPFQTPRSLSRTSTLPN